eukprot:COSAG02_NODE_263_length_26627_cov_47.198168_2_plen_607_part_00
MYATHRHLEPSARKQLHVQVTLRPMDGQTSAEGLAASDANPLAEFQTTEVIREEASFRAVEGQLKGVRTLLKVRRQEPEVPMPPVAELPWELKSESGAEYSYYSATSSAVVTTDYTVEMISPASDAKVDRERPQKSYYVEESAETYAAVSRPLIEAQLSKDEAKLRAKLADSDLIHSRIGWLHNVLSGAKEKERVLHTDDNFLMSVDTKWATHPDCNSTPREEWHGHSSTEQLYCLAIVRDTTLPTLRELRACHLPLLHAILSTGRDTIKKVYGVDHDQLRVFMHYHPQFYHLHVHFTRSHVNPGCEAERAHLLTDVIQNLESDGDYYAKRSVTIRLREDDALYKALSSASSPAPAPEGSQVPKVLTVPDESLFGDRLSRSDSMLPEFEALVRDETRNIDTIQLFSGGSSLGPKMKAALLEAIRVGRVKTLIFSGVEMSIAEIKSLALDVAVAGGSTVWISGGSDQYEVRAEGPPSNTSGNFKTIEALETKCIESIPASEAIYDDSMALDTADTVTVVHNCPLILAAKQVKSICEGPGASAFKIIHFVAHDDKIAKEQGRYSGLIYSHGNIGTIALCSTLFGGIDSGDPDHPFTQAWIKHANELIQ